MTLALTVLGCSGVYATSDVAASGYLLEVDGAMLWLDAGAGTWQRLLQRVDFTTIEAVVLTHNHPDHISDVFQAFHARQYGDQGPLPAIPLWAPRETAELLSVVANDFTESFDVKAVAGGDSVEYRGARLSFTPMVHTAETLGVRIEHEGKTIAYTADTGEAADFEALASGADIFFCEATFQDSDDSWFGHLSASQAGAIASGVGAGRLVLTHLPPGRDHQVSVAEAKRTAGSVPVELAMDGRRFEL